LRRELIRLGADKGIADCLLFAEHHQSHAASAFFPSPFDDAVVLTMDGVGEWATTSVSIGRGSTLETPRYAQLILDRLIDVKADGSFRIRSAVLRLLHRA